MYRLKEKVALIVLLTPFTIGAQGGGCDSRHKSIGADAGASGSIVSSAGASSAESGGRGGGVEIGHSGSTACAAFDNDEPTAPVTIRVTNNGDLPIYFGVHEQICARVSPYTIKDAAGHIRPSSISPCVESCEALQRSTPGCGPACLLTPALGVQPGGSHDFNWHGMLVEHAPMPESCYDRPEAALSRCQRMSVPLAGPYNISLVAWSDWSCLTGPCDCEGADDACTITGEAIVAGEYRETSVTLDFPLDRFVEVIFD